MKFIMQVSVKVCIYNIRVKRGNMGIFICVLGDMLYLGWHFRNPT